MRTEPRTKELTERQRLAIAPVPVTLFPKSLATPSLLAHIVTATFVDGLALHRQAAQFARLGRRARSRDDGRLDDPARRRAVASARQPARRGADDRSGCALRRDTAAGAEERQGADRGSLALGAGRRSPGRRVVLFDYDASRASAVPMRLFEGYRGALVTDGYEVYHGVASAYGLVHAGCSMHTCAESSMKR